jgi:hypothetical protein
MRTRSFAAAVLLLASGGGEAARAEDLPALYGDPVAFGPENVAFPWFADFSPDGRWVGLSDGYSPYVEIWEVSKGTRAWPTDGKARRGTHRVSFSADSSQMAFVDGERLVVLRLTDGAWKEAQAVTLLTKPPTSLDVSPLRLAFEPGERGLVLATGDGAATVDLACLCIEDLGDWKDAVAAFAFPDGTIAVSRKEAFSTHVVPRKDPPVDVAGLVLEADAAATTWLVAPDKTRGDIGQIESDRESRLALEIRAARATAARGSFELKAMRSAGRPLPHRLLIGAQFSRDGKLLATVEGTGVIVVRDATTGAPLQTIREYEHMPYAMGAAFSPDGSRLLTGGRRSEGPQILLWRRRSPSTGTPR